MVKLSGKVRIEFLDENGNFTQEAVEQTNLIFNQTLIDILGTSPNELFSVLSAYSARIVILEDNTEPTPSNTTWTEIAEGYVPQGIVSPLWHESVLPYFGQIENRIDAVTVPRTFYSVGIKGRNSNLCRTKLSLPCTQNPFEVLRIFYQIQILDNKQRLSSRFVRDFGGALFAVKTCYHYVLGCSYANLPNQEYIDPLQPENLLVREPRFDIRTWDNSEIVNNHYKYKENIRLQIRQSGIPDDEDEFIGEIFNTFLVGLSNVGGSYANNFVPGNFKEITQSAYRIEKYQRKTINADPNKPTFQPPFQRIWTHRQGADKPFFDEVNPAVGTGYPSTSGAWSGQWPELYKITIVQGGESGTATYKFSKRLHLGFNGNSYTEKSVKCPFRNPNTPAAVGMHGYREQDNDLLRFSDTEIVQYDLTGATLLDLVNGTHKNWDATTVPSLAVTNLRQCAVQESGKKIYCACRNTGLWVVDVDGNTVSRLSSTPCYGVDVGLGGKVYALLDGSLRSSDNWSAVLPMTYPGLTDGFWSRALFIKVDPSAEHLAVVMRSPNTSTNYRIMWHDASSGTSSDGPEGGYIYPWAASLDVSDGNSFWAINGYRLEFGVDTTYEIVETFSKSVDYEGSSQDMHKIAFYNNFLISKSALIKKDGNNEVEYLEPDNSTTVLHCSLGICIFSTFLRQLFTDNNYCWENYGWNGSWVKDNAGAKTTHATDQALAQGLQIKWNNGNTPPSFYAGDFYTQGILNGTWKDNATTIYYENFWYTRPVNFDTSIPSGVTIPASLIYVLPAYDEPTFLRIETDSINALADFKINNLPVATIYVNGEAPGPNEVMVDGISGEVIFNSADIGKSFSGTYAWIGA
jgi:hypothetical protein